MAFQLRRRERQGLKALSRQPEDARSLRRTLALLWLDEGVAVQEVAERLQVSRQVVYTWASRFQTRQAMPLAVRVADGRRSGRPPVIQGVIDPLIAAVIDHDPQDWGYQAAVWTASLLTHYLRESQALEVSQRSVSLAIARLRIRWKRPRHHLARQSPTWRQAKGGLNAGSRGVPGRFSLCSTRPL